MLLKLIFTWFPVFLQVVKKIIFYIYGFKNSWKKITVPYAVRLQLKFQSDKVWNRHLAEMYVFANDAIELNCVTLVKLADSSYKTEVYIFITSSIHNILLACIKSHYSIFLAYTSSCLHHSRCNTIYNIICNIWT